jgi:hypothetical protein
MKHLKYWRYHVQQFAMNTPMPDWLRFKLIYWTRVKPTKSDFEWAEKYVKDHPEILENTNLKALT